MLDCVSKFVPTTAELLPEAINKNPPRWAADSYIMERAECTLFYRSGFSWRNKVTN
jgi:hypothetical protein